MLKLRWLGARKAAAGIAAAAALAVVATAVPALADPPAGAGGKAVVPASFDMVGVGSNTDDGLFNQLTADYDKTIAASEHGASHPYFYSFNATKPGSTSTAPTKIVTKSGCASIVRRRWAASRAFWKRYWSPSMPRSTRCRRAGAGLRSGC